MASLQRKSAITQRLCPVRQLTSAAHGHTITNRGCWSADGASVLYDLRDDETRFDSPAIERVLIDSLRIERLYEAPHDACCGAPTCSPIDDRFVFIHGEEHPSPQWSYAAWHRRGSIGTLRRPGFAQTLDARDLVAPYTAGALRGGTHLHTFNADATAVLSTYEDHVLATSADPLAAANRRGLAVTVLGHRVRVPATHPRNHDGLGFTTCVTQLSDSPAPLSDEIAMASGEAWVGHGHQIAFQGTVIGADTKPHLELYRVELPRELDQLCRPGDSLLSGTPRTRPAAAAGVVQRRLTDTTGRRYPGIAGPRHWAVSSPDGQWIGFYLRDDWGRVQFWIVSPAGGNPLQVTATSAEPTSAFTWHPDGSQVAYIADGSVMLINLDDGQMQRLTPRRASVAGPTHHGCVFSPDGCKIVFMQPAETSSGRFNQLHVVNLC